MKFSIVVPSYNHEAYLEATLDSILDQGYPDVAIQVNDGGSTDRTVDILARYGQRIRWSSGRDHGQTDAINQGLRQADGDILAYLNSDDLYLPGALAAVAAHFSTHPTCDLLYGDAWHLHADGSIMQPYPTEAWNYDRLFVHCYLCQPAVFWRRRVHRHHGYFDERLHYAMDYDFWLRTGRAAEVHHLAGQPLAGSRLHADTKTLKHRLPAHREILQVVRRHARQPEDCYNWLRHLAAMEAGARGFPASPFPAQQRLHGIAFASRLLILAEQHRIELDDAMLADVAGLARQEARA